MAMEIGTRVQYNDTKDVDQGRIVNRHVMVRYDSQGRIVGEFFHYEVRWDWDGGLDWFTADQITPVQ
jgi:hypothetical protein